MSLQLLTFAPIKPRSDRKGVQKTACPTNSLDRDLSDVDRIDRDGDSGMGNARKRQHERGPYMSEHMKKGLKTAYGISGAGREPAVGRLLTETC